MERLGAATWAAAMDYLFVEAPRRPLAPETYPEIREAYFGATGRPGPAPSLPEPSAALLAEFRDRLAAHQYNAQHPRQFSYFTPPPLPISIVGELLAQWINQGVDIGPSSPTATLVEEEVVRWLCDLVGYDDGAFGVLTSGGVMANVMALTVARDIGLAHLLGLAEPPRGRALEGVRVYASDQAHFSIARALDVLGFPADTLRVIPSNERFQLEAATVAAAVAEDRAAGLVPWCIAAVAGSTNTGSVDHLAGLADLAGREDLWLHVDAAYGGAVRLVAREAGRVPALDRADTITLDPHKWFFQGYDIGGLLVRRRDDLLQTFHRSPEYYRTTRPQDEPLHWYQYSLEGTRRFRALKLWLSWKSLGTEGFGRLIDANLAVAAHLAGPLPRGRRLRGRAVRAGAVGRLLPPPARWSRRRSRHRSGRARSPPGPTPARAGGLGRGLGLDDAPARLDLAACRDRQLPLDRGRRRWPAGLPAPPGGGSGRARRHSDHRPVSGEALS